MKIYKLSQNTTFQMQVQNPNGPANPDITMRNMQESQQAMQFLNNVMQASSELQAKVVALEDALGTTTGLRQTIDDGVKKATAQTPAFALVSKLWNITDVSMLEDQNTVTRIQQQTMQNIQNNQKNIMPS